MKSFNSHALTWLFVLVLLSCSCSKSEEIKEEPELEIVLPATVNGTVESIELKNINEDFASSHEGVLVLKTSNGKKISFSFLYLGAPVYIGDGQWVIGEDNSTVTFDAPSILLQSSILDPRNFHGFSIYTGLQLPNAIHLKFNGKAKQENTKGAKEIHATFTDTTQLRLSFDSFWGTWDLEATATLFEGSRDLSVASVDSVLRYFNHEKGDMNLPAARAWTFYNK